MASKSGVGPQVISLPKGGGALKGIGETFQPNLFTGTGVHSIPIVLSPGRSGFGPTLTLEYSSGSGNGLFGLGWHLDFPRIARKTDKGLPRYDPSDVFVLSGVEDLVPCLEKSVDSSGHETWQPERPVSRPPYTIHRYRPRTEGLFARIERWDNDAAHEVHWRTISKDNVTSIYGLTTATRLADPDDERRVCEWLLQETFDAAGNHVLYEYAKDDPELYASDDPASRLGEIFERNRVPAQRYIRRIYYGNLPSPLLDETGAEITYADGTPVGHLREGRLYAFEVVFDYGDWEMPTKLPHPDSPLPGIQEAFGATAVPLRQDRFSTWRGGFEVRTLRRCRRILMFHHFAELGAPLLVRSTGFDYRNDDDTGISLLASVTVTGYRRVGRDVYRSAAMPPVTFEYSEFKPGAQRFQPVIAEGNSMPSLDLADPNMTLVDLSGDGLPDVLYGGPAGFRYWKNLGNGVLAQPRSMPQVPAGLALSQPGVGFGDIDGDGRADLLVHAGTGGFFETTGDESWRTFRRYRAAPAFELDDPNLRLVDLTGNGLSDALLTGDRHFVWFECLGESGFGAPQKIPRSNDLERFPDVFFNDPAGRIRLADMTGDGLQDIVAVYDGRVDYWPNRGYGRFGARITMANAPRFGFDFDPRRLFLADLSGTGCTDLVYVDFDRIHFWFNQSGNRWSARNTITGTPIVTDATSIQCADVFGTGTTTLLCSSDSSGGARHAYRALDVCGGIKPYVLTEMSNNMGATTVVTYAPSTRYYLEDQANGRPWITRLPFPVQVVAKVEAIDHVSRTRLVTAYKYHHGYFDGREREFRGFARVDQFDTETLEDGSSPGSGAFTSFDDQSRAYHSPTVETRSWFHTGLYFEPESRGTTEPTDEPELTDALRSEFYGADAAALAMDAHVVEGRALRDAYRSLHGALLRNEVYARDGTARAKHPYRVTEHRYRAVAIQPQGPNRHAVCLRHEVEQLTYEYERNPLDPRITHLLTLQVDDFGNPVKTLDVRYGRRQPDPALPTPADRAAQLETFITYTEHRYTNAIGETLLDSDSHRTPLLYETRTYAVTGFAPTPAGGRFSIDEWVENDFARLEEAAEIEYTDTADPRRPQRRLIEHVRTRYRRNDLADLLPPGVVESLALPGETYELAFTPAVLTTIYGTRVNDSMLAEEGGYVRDPADGSWWIPSGMSFLSPVATDSSAEELAYAQRHFFIPRRLRDAFGNTSTASYDSYDLLVTRTTDAVGNITRAEHEYRLLLPFRIVDPNGNRAEVAFDALGLVVGTAVMGKPSEQVGDSLAGFEADITDEQRDRFFTEPRLASSTSGENDASPAAYELLHQATTRVVYDLHRYRRVRRPTYAATLVRETHARDPEPAGGLKVQVSVSYSDGFGREIQKKSQAEPGPKLPGEPAIRTRWIGSGWTIFNNKGLPVQEFEPFFDDTHEFSFARRAGVSTTVFYDPLGRVVATLHPNHTWEKVIFGPWRQEVWDRSDTVLAVDPALDSDVGDFFRRLPDAEYLPTWYALRTDPAHDSEANQHWPEPGPREAERRAARKSSIHAATPAVAHLDPLGRPFLSVAHNRFADGAGPGAAAVERLDVSRMRFDIEGNQREVFDADGRLVTRYDRNPIGKDVHQASMEAGERWTLPDVTGQPIRAWDSRGQEYRTTYDPLRRPLSAFLRDATGAERLVGSTAYGETQPDAEVNNLRGRVVRVSDQAGTVTTDACDFKGNVVATSRRLAREYKSIVDWSRSPGLEAGGSVHLTTYDALNRPVLLTTPDQSVYRPRFNHNGLLQSVAVALRGAAESSSFVTDVDYDAHGQRVRIAYGNGVRTVYEYDPQTYRLARMRTLRGATRLQDVAYTYDACGNITEIRDQAQQAVYFDNAAVTAHSEYTYDALYRLLEAAGREHVGQHSQPQTTWDDAFRARLAHPGDGRAMRRYVERYEYDTAGNIVTLTHRARDANWTRTFAYNESSQLESGRSSNRLSSTTTGGADAVVETYGYDAHGNTAAMPHLPTLQWDFRDQLKATARQVANEGAPETTYYVYDAAGRRVRKVTERQDGSRKNERFYLGAYEVYIEYDGTGTTAVLRRETLHVMDDEQRVALVETRTQGADSSPAQLTRYQAGNHLGSCAIELDGSGEVISYEEYYPYGGTSYQAVRNALGIELKRYRFLGLERDDESGLACHGARYYAPWLGRWISCDPIGLADSLDAYLYAHANPITLSDRGGYSPAPETSTALAPYRPPTRWYRFKKFWEKVLFVVGTLFTDGNPHIPTPFEPDSGDELSRFKEAHGDEAEKIREKNRPKKGAGSPPPDRPPTTPDPPGGPSSKGTGGGGGAGQSGGASHVPRKPLPKGTGGIKAGTAIRRGLQVGATVAFAMALPDPSDAVLLTINYFAAFGEAREFIRAEGNKKGFLYGLSASLLGMSREWVIEKLGVPSHPWGAGGNVATHVLDAQGLAEGSFNRGVIEGFKLGRSLSPEQRTIFLREGFAVLRAQGQRLGGERELLSFEGVVRLGWAIEPTLNRALDAARRQEQEQSRARWEVERHRVVEQMTEREEQRFSNARWR